MVRIWACDHPDQRMKKEEPYYMLGGKVLGLAISRLCVWAISRPYLGSLSAGRCPAWLSAMCLGHISAISRLMLGGKVLDLAWNGESNRLAVVGEGQPPAKARHFPDTSQTLPRHFPDTS